jgi:hypothetical protein
MDKIENDYVPVRFGETSYYSEISLQGVFILERVQIPVSHPSLTPSARASSVEGIAKF